MSTAVATARRSRRRRLLGRNPIGWLFVTPYSLFLALVFAFPVGFALYMSVHDYYFVAPGAEADRPFVGLDNYVEAVTDPVVQRAFFNVLVFLVINVPLTVAGALVLATALNMALPLRTWFRAAYYVPYVTASVAVIGVWLWLFNQDGLVNNVLGSAQPEPSWLVNSFWTMPLIAVYVTWKQIGFFVLIYLAALQNVPKELHEAAALDGAGTVQRFRNVTVPGVRPATFLVVVLSFITGAQLFTEPYLLTGGGGPAGASSTPVLILYQQGITQSRAGYAAAIGVILAVIVIVLSVLNRRRLEGD
ncbi:MAG TPA: sugar ABC transporter permease [Thermoleophilaceae bacterium]|nr:sugar ABC transporter permease [Thermoleophilaceae bacterium]